MIGGVGGNQDIPRSSSLWQPHKEIILVLYRNLTQLVKSAYFIKRIYQEGSSYLTHLKIALAFNLYGGTSSVKLRICWDKWTAWLKEPSAFSNSGMKSSSSLAKDIRQNVKQKNGKNMTTAELYTKLMRQKPVQEQNAPPLTASWKIQAFKAKRESVNQAYVLQRLKLLCCWTSPCHYPEFSHQEQEMLVFGKFSIYIALLFNTFLA